MHYVHVDSLLVLAHRDRRLDGEPQTDHPGVMDARLAALQGYGNGDSLRPMPRFGLVATASCPNHQEKNGG